MSVVPCPGALRAAVANVTSMRAHLDTVLAWEADVLLLPETGGASWPPGHARLAGRPSGGRRWNRGGGGGASGTGGVSVLVRHRLPARQVKPRAGAPAGNAASELWHCVRWCQMVVALVRGRTPSTGTRCMGPRPVRRSHQNIGHPLWQKRAGGGVAFPHAAVSQ